MKKSILILISVLLCTTFSWAQQECIRACNEIFDRELLTKFSTYNEDIAKEWFYDYFKSDKNTRKDKKRKESNSFGLSVVVDQLPISFDGQSSNSSQLSNLSSISEEALRSGFVSKSQLQQIVTSFLSPEVFTSYNNCIIACGGMTNNNGVSLSVVERNNDIVVVSLKYKKFPAGLNSVTIASADYTNGNPLHGKKLIPGTKLEDGQTIFEQIKIDKDQDLIITVNFREAIGNTHTTVKSDVKKFNTENTPVGTIIASILPFNTFLELNNLTNTNNVRDLIWVPCDGRPIISSKYAESGIGNAPDLRGIFMRSVNDYLTPGATTPDPTHLNPDNLQAGEFQDDMFEIHSHGIGGNYQTGGNCMSNLSGCGPRRITQQSDQIGGAETRAKNMSVYYYLKIN